jgi:hypothetical protein
MTNLMYTHFKIHLLQFIHIACNKCIKKFVHQVCHMLMLYYESRSAKLKKLVVINCFNSLFLSGLIKCFGLYIQKYKTQFNVFN